MGVLLVQLLAARGAFVIGGVRGQAKRRAVTRAGALATVDYERPDWPGAVLEATGGARPTVVLDGVGGPAGTAAFGLVADGGRFSAHGTPAGSFASIDHEAARQRQVQVFTIADLQLGPGDRSRLMKEVIERLADRQVRPLIGQTFALTEAARAHEAIEARRTIAKSLLIPG
jgi:NADPH2:quinone reductase